MKKRLFIKNALILTATALLLRFAGIFFKIWLADKIGAEGIGLYQLVFSVYALVSTFASCGISTAVTRLVADELAVGSEWTVKRVLSRAIIFTLTIAFISFAIVFFGAEFIAKNIIGDMRAVSALKILTFSLPFMGASSVFKGYFIARRSATPNSLSQILEQAARIALCFAVISRTGGEDIGVSAAAVLFADTVAEVISCIFTYICYLLDRKHLRELSGRQLLPYSLNRKLCTISMPIAGGRYLGSALRTAENMLVPKALMVYSLDSAAALSAFGAVKGMALPILLFPSSLLNSVSMLLVPEMSEFSATGNKAGIRATVSRMISLTFTFSAVICAIFMAFGQKIGDIIYHDATTGRIIALLSPLVPIMYIDSVADGILKGLDQQFITFRNSVTDSALRIILVLLIVPRFGLNGFIGIMYFSNFLTCGLNLYRVMKITKAGINLFTGLLVPAVMAAVSVLIARFLTLPLQKAGEFFQTTVFCIVSLVLYFSAAIFFEISRIKPSSSLQNIKE